MQFALSMIVGSAVGSALFLATRRHSVATVSIALVLGVVGSAVLLFSLGGWILPDLGRSGVIGIGLLSGVATVLAVGALLRGERRPLNWIAALVSVPPVLFLIVFGVAELLGPAH